jgi:hemerythrin-like domain-containing protein
MGFASVRSTVTHPLQNLKHEHRVIERALRALDGVCARLQWGDHVPAGTLSQLAEFMSTFADQHHHGKEEAYLFPVLQRHGFEQNSGPLGAIAREHQIESQLSTAMQSAIEGYREADPEARQRFIDAARRYIDHLLSHIDKEDAILLRLAYEILDEEDLASLGAGFREAEIMLGGGAIERYDEIASALERDWAL